MKGPRFIIKRVYIEQNNEREIKNHQKKLESITSQDVQKRVITMANEEQNALNKYHNNKSLINDFHGKEKNIEIEKENKHLLRKLVSIAKKGYELPNKHKNKIPTTDEKNFHIKSLKTLNIYERKKKILLLNKENDKFAKRLVDIAPVISSKTHKEEFEKIEKLSNLSKKFHSPKKKGNLTIIKLIDNSIESKFNDQTNKNIDSIINNDSNLKENLESTETNEIKTNEIQSKNEKIINKEEISNNNQENNNVDQDVYINIQLNKLIFNQKKYDPTNNPQEKYFLEIKACYKNLRRTLPESFCDFSKSIINEYFNLNELKKSKLLYIGIYKIFNNKEIFVGDFDFDLEPYLEENVTYDVSADLENLKKPTKNYLPKELGYRGVIFFKLKIKLNEKKAYQLKDENINNSPLKKLLSNKNNSNRKSTQAIKDSIILSKKHQ